jgi:hypothetical protein
VALGGYVNEAQGPDTANVVMRVIRPEAGVAFLLYENRLVSYSTSTDIVRHIDFCTIFLIVRKQTCTTTDLSPSPREQTWYENRHCTSFPIVREQTFVRAFLLYENRLVREQTGFLFYENRHCTRPIVREQTTVSAQPTDNTCLRVCQAGIAYSMYIACQPISEGEELMAWYGASKTSDKTWQHRAASTSKKAGRASVKKTGTRGGSRKQGRCTKEEESSSDHDSA